MNIVMFSGGVTSWAVAKRLSERVHLDNMLLLFADTRIEDSDLYRFLVEAADNVGAQLLMLSEGRTPWEVFHDVKLLGNTHHDPCSRVLKREFLRRWIEKHYGPAGCTIYLGYDWTEIDRWEKAKRYWDPYRVECPLIERPFIIKKDCMDWLRREGIEPPLLNRLGFPHNNCGGFCVKAGHGAFRHLLRTFPKRYELHEAAEEQWRQVHGHDYAILRDRTGSKTKPMTLRRFRERIEAGDTGQLEMDWGGCGCFDP